MFVVRQNSVGLDATFEQFSVAFLAGFVKAAKGRKARQGLSTMKQNDMTVEALAAQFRACAAHVVASKNYRPVDSTTKAGYFQVGQKHVNVSKLPGTVSPEVMSDILMLLRKLRLTLRCFECFMMSVAMAVAMEMAVTVALCRLAMCREPSAATMGLHHIRLGRPNMLVVEEVMDLL